MALLTQPAHEATGGDSSGRARGGISHTLAPFPRRYGMRPRPQAGSRLARVVLGRGIVRAIRRRLIVL